MSSNREVADALTSLSKTSDCIKLRIKDRDCADESGSDTGGEAQVSFYLKFFLIDIYFKTFLFFIRLSFI